MGARHLTRRLAVQALYGLDANPAQGVRAAVTAAMSEEVDPEVYDPELLSTLVNGAWEKRKDIDRTIEGASKNWKLSRMDRVDRSILRLGIYEMMDQANVPAPVILSEAVELAKEFGAPDSPAFINGILDRIARDLRADEVKER